MILEWVEIASECLCVWTIVAFIVGCCVGKIMKRMGRRDW